MAGFPGLSALGGGGAGGISKLLEKIPVVGGALAGAAPLIQAGASLIPGGAVASMAADAVGGIANSAIDAKKDSAGTGMTSSIVF